MGSAVVTGQRVAVFGDWPDWRIEWRGLGQMCARCEDTEVFQPPHLGQDLALQRGKQAVVPRGGSSQGAAKLLQIRTSPPRRQCSSAADSPISCPCRARDPSSREPDRSQGGPSPGRQPAPSGAARDLQGSAAPGAWPQWADPLSIARPGTGISSLKQNDHELPRLQFGLQFTAVRPSSSGYTRGV